MKALTWHQPYAVAHILGLKHWETRSWQTDYRGTLLIHAAKAELRKKYPAQFAYLEQHYPNQQLDFGAIIGTCELTDCIRMRAVEIERMPAEERFWGIWEPGRFAWRLEKIEELPEPIFCKGFQQLWNPEPSLIKKLGLHQKEGVHDSLWGLN